MVRMPLGIVATNWMGAITRNDHHFQSAVVSTLDEHQIYVRRILQEADPEFSL